MISQYPQAPRSNTYDTFQKIRPDVPLIKILFYTDDRFFGVKLDMTEPFGVGYLEKLINEATPSYLQVEIGFLNRHDGHGHAGNKLTPETLQRYDEVWFFGTGLRNEENEPANELTQIEVDALEAWMVHGGVLITGDHANNPPGSESELPYHPLNLGRAIGYKVPRAGRLRRWEYIPISIPPFNYNTHNPVAGVDIESLELDSDSKPQSIHLKKYPYNGNFASALVAPFRSRPHPLFCGRNGPITVFPDHAHEGHLHIREDTGIDWPVGALGVKPLPEIIAWGFDDRHGGLIGLVSAYDGDAASVGRIVGDSTWHHYFNINLWGLQASTLEQIANYYINLVIWLAPRSKRDEMQQRVLFDTAVHPNVLEVQGADLLTLGRTAHSVLTARSGNCLMTDLVLAPWLSCLDSGKEDAVLPPEEFILGGIIEQIQSNVMRSRRGLSFPSMTEMLEQGLKRSYAACFTETAAMVEKLRNGQELIAKTEKFRSTRSSLRQSAD